MKRDRNPLIREMTPDDYQPVFDLWKQANGVDLTRADNAEGFTSFLERNPGFSYVAELDGQIVGAVLCGHDGRRGFMHHLAVAKFLRRQGIGAALVDRSLNKLVEAGLEKCHLFIRRDNHEGLKFWEKIGWEERIELTMASKSM